MNKIIILLPIILVSCGQQEQPTQRVEKVRVVEGPAGKDGAPGKNGRDGRDGVDGDKGNDGMNGRDGVDGKDGVDGVDGISVPPVTGVRFCAEGVSSSFPEYGICIDGDIYAVYWSGKNSWLTKIVPGKYQTTTDFGNCTFTVQPKCVISR